MVGTCLQCLQYRNLTVAVKEKQGQACDMIDKAHEYFCYFNVK